MPWRVSRRLWHQGRSTSPCTSSRPLVIRLDAGDADHDPGRRARRLLRAVRDGPGPRDPGSEGQDGRDRRARVSPRTSSSPACWPTSGSIRARTSTLVEHPAADGQAAARRGQGRRLPRLPAGSAGAARPEDRTRRRQQRGRPAVVAVLLLHGDGQSGVRAQASGRHQAGAAGDLQGDRRLRPRAGAGRAGSRRRRLHASATTMRSRP